MNTASRMESTSATGMVHVSQATYDILQRHGKEHWLTEREDKVLVKGKGTMTTYWLNSVSGGDDRGSVVGSVVSSTFSQNDLKEMKALEDNYDDNFEDRKARTASFKKDKRLVKWNVDVILSLLREIAANRGPTSHSSSASLEIEELEEASLSTDKMVFDEVAECIALPGFNARASYMAQQPEDIDLGPDVAHEALDYVRAISLLYKDNPFHNFEHASHVANSVVKLLSRIIAPEQQDADNHESLHDHTYGITSDPLTRFAVFFSALIHDAGHEGVPNTQLIKEGKPVAAAYRNKSVAEQNSIDICWTLLMQDDYTNLRRAIYGNSVSDFNRFRQLVVNVVLATDIMDKELKELRNNRWDKAFFGEGSVSNDSSEGKKAVDRKATIVIEHLIQASDVAHTMQHWQVYRKWNERLFRELAKAYEDGRATKHPVEFWYDGEIGFFDFYIIPLAKKLRNCGVFGVSSDEYLSYAKQNREEWALRGKEMVEEYLQRLAVQSYASGRGESHHGDITETENEPTTHE